MLFEVYQRSVIFRQSNIKQQTSNHKQALLTVH